ncbi:phosphomannomutase/phosphoglucomutase [Candidatus Beckwithbacteria bacterium CG10_big_fil_rev_8_21_14_0_10_34_10]|uniref:Phosphomannomutase/phosphoglucomutase n=1 Tax=Candidatus Beckwithbacteria bacterium CG10_big_fil_rev_8_21_14_0_10_34_10 TaxID=1974495 RepID=A0A2H0WAE2_9BACT|nr:MAG: phosphomannomutase/phosphoglucomutase [Candidatus Beckwithbacteria bacterium CG10_big_fil_rev_8_21_14_0_10_34_10]
MIKANIFRDYDVRAIVPQELDKKGAIRIGQVLVNLFKPKTVAIGHDMRITADEIAGGIAEGIMIQGANVTDLGLISTDMAYFASGKYGYDLALSVSASHNPSEYNGFKVVKKGAIAISGNSGIYDIRDLALSDEKFIPAKKRGILSKRDIYDEFIKHCLSFTNLKKIKPFKVVIDAGNAMAGFIIPKFEKYLPIKVIPLYFKLDGNFPNHIPNPLLPEATSDLKKEVLKKKADFGLAFDGDGDRMYFIDEKGKLVTGTITTAMISEMILRKNKNKTILYNAVTGKIVPQIIKKYGGKGIRVRVGHTLIKEDMRKYKAYFAGEHSGHYYFKENYYADSAFVAMLIALELISEENKTLSEITGKYDIYPSIPETNFEVKDKEKVMKNIEKHYKSKADKIDWLDGVTIWFKDWWANIRPSNTQPLLRLNIEADNNEILIEKENEFTDLIQQLGGKKTKE